MTKRLDLRIRQGETWAYTHTHTSGGSPVDLTGYAARMSIKMGFGSGYMAHLTTDSTTSGGKITLGGAAGTIKMEMTAAESAKLAGEISVMLSAAYLAPTERWIKAMYDLEIVSPAGTVNRVIEGNLYIQREVTS